MRSNKQLNQAYSYCQQLANSHYENFPVASRLLPHRMRAPIAAIYAFARTADDFADEGDISDLQRLHALSSYHDLLRQIEKQQYRGRDPIFIALQDTVTRCELPIHLLHNLLKAFEQDVVKSRYHSFSEVLDYCQFSANPVGHLLLHINGQPTQQQLTQSDAICTALQLINFYQDVIQDYTEQDRIYLPQDELQRYGLDETHIITDNTEAFAPLMLQLYNRTSVLFENGYLLGMTLNGRFGWEVRAICLAGLMLLIRLIEQPKSDMFSRPRLTRRQILSVMLTSLNKRRYYNSVEAMLQITRSLL
ncbi:MAG: squalene synthase HpnC [Methylophaga sp.]|nr:squalene synthase HpnC [Methylophaga sp.]